MNRPAMTDRQSYLSITRSRAYPLQELVEQSRVDWERASSSAVISSKS